MLKKLLIPAALLLAVLAPVTAKADYVCQTEYYPGSNARIKLLTTASANCTGATRTSWICEPTNTGNFCGIFRYSVSELLSLQNNLVRAADSQQYVAPSLTTCTGTTATNCLYSIAFKQ